MAALIEPQRREREDRGHCGCDLCSLRVAATDARLLLSPKAGMKNKRAELWLLGEVI